MYILTILFSAFLISVVLVSMQHKNTTPIFSFSAKLVPDMMHSHLTNELTDWINQNLMNGQGYNIPNKRAEMHVFSNENKGASAL